MIGLLGPAAVLLAALVLDRLLPSPPTAFHPVGWMGAFIRRCWRYKPSPVRRLPSFVFGLLLVLAGTALFLSPWHFSLGRLIPG